MPRGVANTAAKIEAIRLRTEERLSIGEIEARLGVNRSTLHLWIKPYPLTQDEWRQKRANIPVPRRKRKDRGSESVLHRIVAGVSLTRQQKGRIAETAVLLRLLLHGFNPIRSPFDGDRTDWFVELSSKRIIRLQVKWAGQPTAGLPLVRLNCTEGHNRQRGFRDGEADVLVGYSLFTDTAYVWTWEEIRGRKTITVGAPSSKEAWHKLAAIAQG